MNIKEFYGKLFAAIEKPLGRVGDRTITAIVGFDGGGPLSFATIGSPNKQACITYVSCELAVRKEQQPNSTGRFELLVTCDDETWVRSVITDIGRMSLETIFDDGHTMDIGQWVGPAVQIQGVAFENAAAVTIGEQPYGILRCIGITRAEMEFAQANGASALFARLKTAGVYPNTIIKRKSVI